MSKFRNVWNEYLKEPAKKWVAENLFDVLQSFVKKLLNRKKKEEAPAKKVKTYPIKWEKSPNFSSRKGAKIQAIILHHTGKGGLKAAKSWIKNKKSQVSYHYIIDRNGDIYHLVKEANKAWHAGKSKLNGKSNVNPFSIGIAFVSNGVDKYTPDQYDSSAWLCSVIKKKYTILNNWIVGHKTIAPERKHDPANFDWYMFFDLLNLKCL